MCSSCKSCCWQFSPSRCRDRTLATITPYSVLGGVVSFFEIGSNAQHVVAKLVDLYGGSFDLIDLNNVSWIVLLFSGGTFIKYLFFFLLLTCVQFVAKVYKAIYLWESSNGWNLGRCFVSLTGGHEGALCQDRSTAMVKAGGWLWAVVLWPGWGGGGLDPEYGRGWNMMKYGERWELHTAEQEFEKQWKVYLIGSSEQDCSKWSEPST